MKVDFFFPMLVPKYNGGGEGALPSETSPSHQKELYSTNTNTLKENELTTPYCRYNNNFKNSYGQLSFNMSREASHKIKKKIKILFVTWTEYYGQTVNKDGVPESFLSAFSIPHRRNVEIHGALIIFNELLNLNTLDSLRRGIPSVPFKDQLWFWTHWMLGILFSSPHVLLPFSTMFLHQIFSSASLICLIAYLSYPNPLQISLVC